MFFNLYIQELILYMFAFNIFSHNIKLWVSFSPLPEQRRRLCWISPFPTPPCHHDRGSSCCYGYCCFWTPPPFKVGLSISNMMKNTCRSCF